MFTSLMDLADAMVKNPSKPLSEKEIKIREMVDGPRQFWPKLGAVTMTHTEWLEYQELKKANS